MVAAAQRGPRCGRSAGAHGGIPATLDRPGVHLIGPGVDRDPITVAFKLRHQPVLARPSQPASRRCCRRLLAGSPLAESFATPSGTRRTASAAVFWERFLDGPWPIRFWPARRSAASRCWRDNRREETAPRWARLLAGRAGDPELLTLRALRLSKEADVRQCPRFGPRLLVAGVTRGITSQAAAPRPHQPAINAAGRKAATATRLPPQGRDSSSRPGGEERAHLLAGLKSSGPGITAHGLCCRLPAFRSTTRSRPGAEPCH